MIKKIIDGKTIKIYLGYITDKEYYLIDRALVEDTTYSLRMDGLNDYGGEYRIEYDTSEGGVDIYAKDCSGQMTVIGRMRGNFLGEFYSSRITIENIKKNIKQYKNNEKLFYLKRVESEKLCSHYNMDKYRHKFTKKNNRLVKKILMDFYEQTFDNLSDIDNRINILLKDFYINKNKKLEK